MKLETGDENKCLSYYKALASFHEPLYFTGTELVYGVLLDRGYGLT